MPANPYKPPTNSAPPELSSSPIPWTPSERVLFLLAAIPAAYLPVSYLAAIAHGLLLPGLIPSRFEWFVWPGAGYLCAIQLPIYFVWLAISRELNSKQKAVWLGVLLLLNMLAIPTVLMAKYRRTTVSWLQSGK